MQPNRNIKVYYEGGCPLCRREIAFYRRTKGANNVDWIDLSDVSGDDVAPDLTCAAALERFHVRRADGLLLTGAAAFAE